MDVGDEPNVELMIDLYKKSFVEQELDPLKANPTTQIPSMTKRVTTQQLKSSRIMPKTETGMIIGILSPAPGASPMNTIEQDEPVVLGLDELERIFQAYHGDKTSSNYFQCKTIERERKSNVPLLERQSLFFTCFDDNVYESVLEDLKKEYTENGKDSKIGGII